MPTIAPPDPLSLRHAHEHGKIAPVLDWGAIQPSEHFVQFYERDGSLIRAVSEFIGAGLAAGESGIVIATTAHREGIEAALRASGLDLDAAQAQGHYIALDAAETLSRFMDGGTVDPQRFNETIGRVVARAAADGGKRVRAFGEMVALLWSGGNTEGAIRLEEVWNELLETQTFSLFCAYALDGFGDAAHTAPFAEICACHSRVIPAESYAALGDPEAQLREITLLQQRAKALEAEVARREKVERELSDFLENATEGIHKVGPDGTILWANRAELEMLGYAPDEYIGRSITEFHLDEPVIHEMLTKLLCGETLFNYPARLRCKDGTVKHVLVHSNACVEGGEFRYTRCFTRDVTYLREAQIARQRLAAIVESSDDAIIGKTLDGIITSWNKGAERVFGYTAEEAVGRPKTLVFPPDRLQEEDEILARLRRGEYIDHFESVRRRKDGSLIDVSVTISPIRDGQGNIVGASTIARDITQARRQQRELALLNARLQRAMTETHHRVKNNLQLIAALIDMQRAAVTEAGAQSVPASDLDRLGANVRTLGVIHDILTQEAKAGSDQDTLSSKATLERLARMIEQTAGERPLRYAFEDARLPGRQATALALVTNELVSNALKHGRGVTEVHFRVDGGEATLVVEDDGTGFPEGFSAESANSTGLELVENIATWDLSGQVSYGNRPEGGARVKVTFPLAVAAAAKTDTSP